MSILGLIGAIMLLLVAVLFIIISFTEEDEVVPAIFLAALFTFTHLMIPVRAPITESYEIFDHHTLPDRIVVYYEKDGAIEDHEITDILTYNSFEGTGAVFEKSKRNLWGWNIGFNESFSNKGLPEK